jgi:hypothetical protein
VGGLGALGSEGLLGLQEHLLSFVALIYELALVPDYDTHSFFLAF